MIITSIEAQKKENDRFNIFVDDEFLCGLSGDVLIKYGFYKGRTITTEEISSALHDDLVTKIYLRVANFASRGDKTVKMAKDYISKLFYQKKRDWFESELMKSFQVSPDQNKIAETVIEKVIELKYLNDADYAENFIKSRLSNRPRSKRLIMMELQSKGVGKDIAEEAFLRIEEGSGIDELTMAREQIKKKFGITLLTRENAKAVRFLQGKGYDWDLISKLMKDDSGE